jgi:hypothetical protein
MIGNMHRRGTCVLGPMHCYTVIPSCSIASASEQEVKWKRNEYARKKVNTR